MGFSAVQGVYLFQQVQKKQRGVGWDFENTMKKKVVFNVVSSIFHYCIFLFYFFGGLKFEVDE